MNWLSALRALPETRLVVQHEPETLRYARAREKIEYLLRASDFVGQRPADTGGAVELAFWAPPPRGRGDGYYWCARTFSDPEGALVFAVVFCFYDGTEASPGFATVGGAREFASEEGFDVSDE